MITGFTSALIEPIRRTDGPERPAFHILTDAASGKWEEMARATFRSKVTALAAMLLKLGLEPQQTVGIMSNNRPEVLMISYAAWQVRAVTAGIYATSSLSQVRFIVDDASIRFMLVDNQAHYEAARAAGVGQIIVTDRDVTPEPGDRTTLYFDDFEAKGHEALPEMRSAIDSRAGEVMPDDLATLLYTSGTTGEPKGAMLSHYNFTAQLEAHHLRFPDLTEADTSLSFLPLSHIFELAWCTLCIYLGISIYINPDPKRIQQSLRETRPTCMCSVPRFWEKVYIVVQEKLSSMSALNRALLKRALSVGKRRNLEYLRAGKKVPALLEREYQMYNGRVFRKVRKAIGVDNGHLFPTAGAPIAPEIVEFCHSIGINMAIGYGLSETTATVSCFPAQNFAIGSVGTLIPDVKVRIGDHNEIEVKGPTVMSGYYNRPALNAEAFTSDGWFRTGDAGRLDSAGNLWLTDRIKDLFKTSNGKYVAPQAIESRLCADALFEQVAVIGDRRKFVSALIVPDYSELGKFAESHKLGHLTREELVRNPRIVELVTRRLEELMTDFAPYEHIKRFTLLTKPFTIEDGELTNTLKVRRRVVADRYAETIDRMYE